MMKSLLYLAAVLALVAVLVILLLRKLRRRERNTLNLDFNKAKANESRKHKDLSAYP